MRRDGPEIRTHSVPGTKYVRVSIWIAGAEIHAQLSPYSDAEIAERVRHYHSPQAIAPVKGDNWGARGTFARGPTYHGLNLRTGQDE